MSSERPERGENVREACGTHKGSLDSIPCKYARRGYRSRSVPALLTSYTKSQKELSPFGPSHSHLEHKKPKIQNAKTDNLQLDRTLFFSLLLFFLLSLLLSLHSS